MSDNLVQVYSVYINAPAQKVWDAITQSEYTTRWGYGGAVEADLRPGGVFRNLTTDEMKQMGMGDIAVDGHVVELDPPKRLVLDWKPSWYPDAAPTRLTWELIQFEGGLTRVVLTHDVTAAPQLAAEVAGGGEPAQGGGGWLWSLSGLKTLLETGRSMDEPAA
ncbi:SRPBCC domain-containing protein [Auraticoccus monumenti]|uniref:Uncharacterized conserved protein YndB, AHSA1/START domain n=1 Tax=Auraticoccus monumenti TaxID=675864 RepID=A0A1G6W7H4_9ACTN|nr:SRPBCC domain-containing protein [Auraticoccus monumenti]SDD61006.1 Uncharacterized conserved protein YndB, AHSA1/START domain [Auraticoccus monumenti]